MSNLNFQVHRETLQFRETCKTVLLEDKSTKLQTLGSVRKETGERKEPKLTRNF